MNQSDSDLTNCMDNNLEHDEQSSAIPNVQSNDSIEDTPPNGLVEVARPSKIVDSETVKNDKIIFVKAPFLFSDNSCFEKLGFTVLSVDFGNPVPKDYYEKNLNKIFVLAFENNSSGIKIIEETIECFELLGIGNYKIALLPKGISWNDLKKNNQLAIDTIEKTLNEA